MGSESISASRALQLPVLHRAQRVMVCSSKEFRACGTLTMAGMMLR